MSAEFKLTANGSGAVRAVEDLNKILDETQATADGVTKASKFRRRRARTRSRWRSA